MKRQFRLQQIKKFFIKIYHRFDKYEKNERFFIFYLFVLSFLLLFFPIIKVNDLGGLEGYSIRLFSISYFKTMLIMLLSVVSLILRNVSFRFKNFIITYLGFKENIFLVNFGLLWIITTSFFGITDTINVFSDSTSRINTTRSSQFIQILLLLGLVFTLLTVIKGAKQNVGKAKIVNVIDENAIRENQSKRVFQGLFDEEKDQDN